MDIYLQSTFYIDADNPDVKAYAYQHTHQYNTQIDKALALYYAIRDGFRYHPFELILEPKALKASHLLTKDYGYCIEKAVLLAASARAAGIPSRLGFANVKNHVGAGKMEELLRSNVMVFHGYTELLLDQKWVKATPAFNKQLCDKLGVAVLEFDGKQDSIFQENDGEGGTFMEYIHEYGTFADFPFELFLSEFINHYPHMFELPDSDLPGWRFKKPDNWRDYLKPIQ